MSIIVLETGYYRIQYRPKSNLLYFEEWQPDPAGRSCWVGAVHMPLPLIKAAMDYLAKSPFVPISEAQAAMDAG